MRSDKAKMRFIFNRILLDSSNYVKLKAYYRNGLIFKCNTLNKELFYN